MAAFNKELILNETTKAIETINAVKDTALNGLLSIVLATASSSALAALAYGAAYLTGITTLTAAMSCGAFVAATAIGAAILSMPIGFLIGLLASDHWFPRTIRLVCDIAATIPYSVLGAAILGLAIGPAALGGALTAGMVIAVFTTIAVSILAGILIYAGITGWMNSKSDTASNTHSTARQVYRETFFRTEADTSPSVEECDQTETSEMNEDSTHSFA